FRFSADRRRGCLRHGCNRKTTQGVRRGAQDRRPPPMSDMQRETLAVLAQVWDLSPDVRLGQLLAHLGFLGEAHMGKGLGYIEDDELVAVLYLHRAELRARLETAAVPGADDLAGMPACA